MKFSQRIGKRPVKTVLQVESIDIDLKNRLWNVFIEDFYEQISDDSNYSFIETERGEALIFIWKEMFGKTVDSIPRYSNSKTVNKSAVIDFIRDWFFNTLWYDIYDFIEFISINTHIITKINEALEREVAGYRIINDQVIQITSEGEIAEIEQALTDSDQWKSVNTHLQSALDFLSDRKNPDYRNSIKESISAVESLCIIITGDTSTTLGKALVELERKHSLHGSLKGAFSALYGYTSDAGGIRHSLLENSITPTFEDAKFMLVSCSAFINYLKAKMQL